MELLIKLQILINGRFYVFLKMASHRLLSSLSANDVGRLAEPLLILLSVHRVVLVLHDLHGKTGNVDSDKPPLDHHV